MFDHFFNLFGGSMLVFRGVYTTTLDAGLWGPLKMTEK